MVSQELYSLLIAAIVCERIAELVVSNRNASWSFKRGGREYGKTHFPFMVALHTALLAGCLLEVWIFSRLFEPFLGFSMLAVTIGCQALRWWAIKTLGPMWNTRVIVVPGLPQVKNGPFRYLHHPNYLAVVLEGMALPLIHGAWVTALLFTLGNIILLRIRIPIEERALQLLKSGK